MVAEHGDRAGGGGGAAASPGGGGDLGGWAVGVVGGGNDSGHRRSSGGGGGLAVGSAARRRGAISATGDRPAVDKAEGLPVPEEDEEAAVRPRGRHSRGHVQPVAAYGGP
jgi:hypothetical protein